MRRWRQLRWQIVSANLIVIGVGVTILLAATRWLIATSIPSDIRPRLTVLAEARDPQAVAQAMTNLTDAFQSTVLTSLLLAAFGAFIAGLITSLLLSRAILRPLNDIAAGSRRIADGHFDERVAVPDSVELASVAVNFNEMAQALQEVEQQRIALIGNVSHELRTPLTGIEGYLEGMMDGLFPDNTETFAHMYQEVRRLRRLVNDLQDLSKVEAGQVRIDLESFDLLPIIERVITQLQPQAVAQKIDLKAQTYHPPLTLFADPDRTAQILMNLIGNAIRYTPEGGQVEVACRVDRAVAAISVRDNGLGIPPEALPYVFERFYRVDSSRARRSGGSGIGLTISRHLAWAMHGDLTAASPGPGQGSTFTLTLPLADKS